MIARKKRKLGFVSRLILVLNFIAVFLLLAGYSASFINPHFFWPPALIGLLVPYLFVINLFFSVFWIIRRKWWFVISLVAVLIGIAQLNRYISMDKRSELKLTEKPYFKVSSYNVKNLSNDNVRLSNDSIRERIFELVRSNHPDILCMQEFMTTGANAESLFDNLGAYAGLYDYRYISYVTRKNEKNKIDAIVTYSKFPIIRSFPVRKDEIRNLALATDILLKHDTVRIYNVHLESIHFQQEDYEFLSEMPRPELEQGNFRESSWNILKKLRRAFRKRALQAELLADHIRSSPYPVIVCGDFNDTPSSYASQKLARGLNDAFAESDRGTGTTYHGKVPSYRIDYILYDDWFQSFNYHTVKVHLSDHFMISTYLLPSKYNTGQ